MALARHQFPVVNQAGDVQPFASIEVRSEVDGRLVQLFSDRDGTVTLGNPFLADAEGFAAFHVVGGAYRVKATLGNYQRTHRWVGIGTASERDWGGAFLPRGAWDVGTTYATGEIVSHQVFGTEVYAFISNEEGNLGNEPSFNGSPLLPVSDEHWTAIGILLAGPPGIPGVVGDITFADTAPSSPANGDWWCDTTTNILYFWFEDGDSGQWVSLGSDIVNIFNGGNKYTLAINAFDRPLAGETLLRHVFEIDVQFRADFSGSQASADIAATAETVFSLTKNGTPIGTITFAAAGDTGSFDIDDPIDFAAGDILRLVAPASRDDTLADISFTLAGAR